ncbi:hypothetical protein PVAND_010468 [Polypedilum vanderplanki]|uniref:Peptidoglycan recognition protein family domain-containing protein n=1 Tax=Polypedilum vanderplanki TaxID=319348 RepID=A0A9J6CFQ3_POLVA|nr:hypothetical protein PVAND_010468 [Polypedilum vanderplanki]
MEQNLELNQISLRDCDTSSTLTATNSEISVNISEVNEVSQTQKDSITLPQSNVSTNINSLALQSSSGVHFGNSVVYNLNGAVNLESKNVEINTNEKFNLNYLLRHKAMLTLSVCSFLFFALLVLVLAIKFDNSVNEVNVNYPYDLKIIKRNEWKAVKPSAQPKLLNTPVNIILFDCTGMHECYNERDCSEIVRKIQHEHMTVKGFPDIGYNFIIGNNGLVYEGTGWNIRGSYAHDDTLLISDGLYELYNASLNYEKMLSIAYNGNECDEVPYIEQIFARYFLASEGLRLNKFFYNSMIELNLIKERKKKKLEIKFV